MNNTDAKQYGLDFGQTSPKIMLSGYKLYVLGYQAMYEDFCADFDNIYSSIDLAQASAEKLNNINSNDTTSPIIYEVYSLVDAIDKIKLQSRLEGERSNSVFSPKF